MKKLLFTILFLGLFWASNAHGAIAYDAVSGVDDESGNPASVTFAHTMSATANGFLRCDVRRTTSDATTATFNGVSMSLYASVTGWYSTAYIQSFFLYAPASGTHNVVVTATTGNGAIYVRCNSYTGVAQTGYPDAYSTNNGTGTTLTGTVTTVANNAWLTMFFKEEQGGTASAGANTTIRHKAGLYASLDITDTNAAMTPTGSYSQTVSWSGSNAYVYLVMSLAPAVAATAPPKNVNIILFE